MVNNRTNRTDSQGSGPGEIPTRSGLLGGGSEGYSRRDMFRLGGALAATAVGASALTACGAVPGKPDEAASQKSGGTLSHGATGGGLTDTIDPHFPVTPPDISRVSNLYEPLLFWDDDYKIQPALAMAVTPNKDATKWTIELRKDVVFHNGRKMTADDVMFTLARMTDKKNPSPAATDLASFLDLKNSRKRDPYTIELQLSEPYAVLDWLLAEYTAGIVPVDFDIKNPVGTGAFRADKFLPGTMSRFLRWDDYWGDNAAWVDDLFIYNFADDSAKVNALLAGQIQTLDYLPSYLVDSLSSQGCRAMVSDTGAWTPFTMRVDREPYKDVRVRQALRMICDRQQMIDQALNGYGFVGNDLYAPFDPDYAKDLPQREQDVEQAKSLLKQAGAQNLQVELITSTAAQAGAVESATLYVDQARKAGIDVRLTKMDPTLFYGERYLSYDFAQDFWNTRNYIPQVANCALPSSPYNETHFDNPKFNDLYNAAKRETDDAKRGQMLQDCQQIEYEEGGYIIWGFKQQVDGASNLVQGMKPSRYLPCGSYKFQNVSFV